MTSPPDIQKIAIVGTGLLGGSAGLALRAAGFGGRIVGVGRRASTLDAALAVGCIDEAATDLIDACRGADLVLLTTPVGAIGPALDELAAADVQAVITDAGSTKRSIVEHAERTLSDASRFVGAHPMAGGEKHGPEHASAELFQGRPVVITPTPRTGSEAMALVERFWRSLGMRPVRMTPEGHDAAVARVSHLPHAAAVALVEVAGEGPGLDIASTGYRDTTRVAAGDATVWADIFHDNADEVIASLDALSRRLATLRALIAAGDREGLARRLDAVKAAREAWSSQRPDVQSGPEGDGA